MPRHPFPKGNRGNAPGKLGDRALPASADTPKMPSKMPGGGNQYSRKPELKSATEMIDINSHKRESAK
jgi:hypothetical protein